MPTRRNGPVSSNVRPRKFLLHMTKLQLFCRVTAPAFMAALCMPCLSADWEQGPVAGSDSGRVIAKVYAEWSAHTSQTAQAALQCMLRPPGWAATLSTGLQLEWRRRMAGAREQTSDKTAFEAYENQLRSWAGTVRTRVREATNPAACNRLEMSEELKIADLTVARFSQQLGP